MENLTAAERYLIEAQRAAEKFAQAASSGSTLKSYERDFKDFEVWCEGVNIASLPAEPRTVAAYLSSLVDAQLKASTIRRRKAAIAWTHRHEGFESPTASKAVIEAMRGINRTIGTAADQKAPLTDDILHRVLGQIPTSTLTDLRDRALLAMGFATALRRSELVALDVTDIRRVREGAIVHIGRSKTDQEGRGQQVIVPKGTHLRPLKLLDEWLGAAGIATGAIWRPIAKGDRLMPVRLTDRSVARIIKARVAEAGFDPDEYSGHSLRSGFITSALEHGADVFAAADHARHKRLETTRHYDQRRKLFANPAGKGFL